MQQEIKTIADLKVHLISQWYREKTAGALVISHSPFFVPAVNEWLHHGEHQQRAQTIRQRLELLKDQFGFEDIILASAQGDLLLSTDRKTRELDSATRTAIRTASPDHEPVSGDFYVSPSHKKTHFEIITPLRDENSQTLAFLVIRDDPHANLYPMLATWPTPRKTAETILLRRDGDSVLYLNILRSQNNPAFVMRESLSDRDNPAVQAVLGRRGLFEGINDSRAGVLAYITQVPNTPWCLVAQVNHDEIFAVLMYRALITGVMTFLLIVVLLSGLAYYYRSRQKSILHSLFIKEKELREYHEEFRTILYSIADGVITTDLHGHVKQMNHAAEQLTGWNEAEAVGVYFDDLFKIINDETRKAVENPITKVLRDGAIDSTAAHIVLLTREGKEIPITHSGAPIRNKGGIIEGTVLIFHNKTVEDQAEKLLLKSEEKYKIVADNTSSWEFWLSPERNFIYNSPACKRTTGYDAEMFVHQPELMIRIIHADDRPDFLRHWNETDTARRQCDLEYRINHADGSIRWIQHICNPVFNEHGQYLGVRGSNRDITGRKKGEEALRRSLSLVQATLESTTDGILVIDSQGKIAGYNQQFKTMWNIPAEVLQTEDDAKTLSWIVKQLKYPAAFLEKVNYLYQNPEADSFDSVEFIDGRTFERYSQPQRIDGLPMGRVWSFRDITERKSLERQLIQSQKLEGIGTLAGGIAHDFNNLLSMILGSAELLRMHIADQPHVQKYVDRIVDASARGTSISRQLLTFARPYETELKPLSASRIISEVRELLTHFLPKSIDIRTSTEIDDCIIMGDAGQIHQAILNLAINAGDAMINSGTLTIKEFAAAPHEIPKKFGPQSGTSYVAVSVSDTGIGIDAAMLDKIFNPFFSTKAKGKGTGLGLSIVHGIMKNHSGFLDVSSTVNQGTTFTMYFPSISARVNERHSGVDRPAARHDETILLADDEMVIRDMLSEYLGQCGFRVLTAADGHEALESFKKNRDEIKIVITDLGMPQMGGEELFRQLYAIDPEVKVIASSGYLDGTTKDELRAIGFKEILTKPYQLQEMKNMISRMLTAECEVLDAV